MGGRVKPVVATRPRSMVFFGLSLAFGGTLASVHAQCEPSPEVQRVLAASSAAGTNGQSTVEIRQARQAVLVEGLAKAPDDFFLQRAIADDTRAQRIKRLQTEAAAHPGDRTRELLLALALEGTDTPEAIRRLGELETVEPVAAQAHLALERALKTGRFVDKERAERELAAFLDRCPAPLEAQALRILLHDGTPTQAARVASTLRSRLAARTDLDLSEMFQLLWALEFKGTPMHDHGLVRQRIAADLARLRSAAATLELKELVFLRDGYGKAEDKTAVADLEAEIVRRFPTSRTAELIAQDRWRSEHPRPLGEIEETAPVPHLRAQVAAEDEWCRRWPSDPALWWKLLSALDALPDTLPERLASAADSLLRTYRSEPTFHTIPRLVEFQVADSWVKAKAHLDETPQLVATAYADYLTRSEELSNDDRRVESVLKEDRIERGEVTLERDRILLGAYASMHKLDAVAGIADELAHFEAEDRFSKAQALALRGRAAETLGHPLDALVFARESEASAGYVRGESPTAAIARLWKQLGGSDAAMALFKPSTGVVEVAEAWKRPPMSMPRFALTDLEGKVWRSEDLVGKTVLVNVWATWCGPCRAEHPQFQKLYERLKSRSDIVVLSFNVDVEPSGIEPYLKQNRYTFPVVQAAEFVNGVIPELGIPRNWIIGPKGTFDWEQVGYGPGTRWEEQMIAKLDEVAKGN